MHTNTHAKMKIHPISKPAPGAFTHVFMCPGCHTGHGIIVNNPPGPSWQFNGDVDRPTITPSILVNRDRVNPAAEVCHSFVNDGKIQFLSDCTHAMAGQTVELPDF